MTLEGLKQGIEESRAGRTAGKLALETSPGLDSPLRNRIVKAAMEEHLAGPHGHPANGVITLVLDELKSGQATVAVWISGHLTSQNPHSPPNGPITTERSALDGLVKCGQGRASGQGPAIGA
ncbi:hypothetical protein [Amycolatopsis keratiniphila]|uniref:hypothetical protein n=1 Tax=Amycolatopsis keratiniphila TaxID=129921 RepID=UPI00117C796C|nr:hypothetical protein [Amycolatopsis keratiniphila]